MARLTQVMAKIQLIEDKVQTLVDEGDAQALLDKMDMKLEAVNANLDTLLQKKASKTNILNSNIIPVDDINIASDNGILDEGNESISGGQTQDEADEGTNEAVPANKVKGKPIQVYSAQRNRTGVEENTFTIKLEKNTDNMLYRVHGGNQGFPVVPEVTENGNVCSVLFTLRNSSNTDPDIWFLATDMDDYNFIALKLDNSFGDAVASYEFGDLPKINITPYDREAVYEYGENLEMEVEVIKANYSSMENDVAGVTDYFFGVDLETLEFHNSGGNYEWFNKSEFNNPDADRVQQTVTVMTANHPISGFYSLSYHIRQEEAELVKRTQISKYLLVRPSNQSGPFPPAYLSMVDTPGREKSENGNEKWSCRVGTECPIACQAAGENLTSIAVFEILLGGEKVEVLSAQSTPIDVQNSKSLAWMFKSEHDSGDLNGITTFRCEAYDTVHMRTVHKLIDVEAFIESRIVKEKSGVRVRNSMTNPGEKEITFSCYVEGRPLPNVTFTFGAIPISDRSDFENVPVRVVTDDRIGGYAMKRVSMTESEFRRARDNIEQQLSFCSVPSRYYSPGDTFIFDLSEVFT